MENIAAIDLRIEHSRFEIVFQENYTRVYRLLFRLTGQHAEAEDLTVDTFLRYLQHPPANDLHLDGWMCRVATRLGLNALRASKRRARYEDQAALYQVVHSHKSVEDLELAAERWKVRNALRRMKRRNAELLLMYHSGFSYNELAASLNLSSGSIGTLISRAEKQFEKLYRQS